MINSFAGRLQDRKLFKCVDVRTKVQHRLNPDSTSSPESSEQIDACCKRIISRLEELANETSQRHGRPAILSDEASRTAYKTEDKQKGHPIGPVERINIKTDGGASMDLRERSDVVAGIGDFKLTRTYFDSELADVKESILEIINQETVQCR